MGTVTMGPPKDIVLELARLCGATVFVETGTFRGTTADWASNHFERVYTIERDEGLFRLYSRNLPRLSGVTPLLGDSRVVLPTLLPELADRRTIFWLDGHWSGGDTAGADDECPLIGELANLYTRQEDIILIDDARLFLSAPPPPHNPNAWPNIADIVHALDRRDDRTLIQIIDDVIFAVPNKKPLTVALVNYAQERSKVFWFAYGRSWRRRIRNVAGAVRRRLSPL